MVDHPLLTAPVPVPVELEERARAKGWDDGLLERALNLRVPRADIEFWLTADHVSPDRIRSDLDTLDRVFCGPLRTREATWRDAEALVDLYANAPEQIGPWDLIVERGPNPYAQFRLQEHVNIQVVECRGVLLGATAHSARNTIIGGERVSAHLMSAWRVRSEFRGKGISRLLQMAPGPGTAWFGVVTYWYERSDNASQGWLDKIRTEIESRGNIVGQLSATVHQLAPADGVATPDGLVIRPVEPGDLARCVELVNGTHEGLDLFRPYSVDFLECHLDDPSWGPKPPFWSHVFGWEDYAVVEDTDSGEIVACGGLWDKGRDVREVWVERETGARNVLEPTALLDWGHAPGRDDAMAALIHRFRARTRELGRTGLLAPLTYAPALLERLAEVVQRTETRAVRCMGFHEGDVHVEPQISRPYTDLVYW